ncbi:hypothetical protein [Polaromonas sp. CG9_12]|nr:hypothetical protein [Polaromonas sp. CG9_12]
MKALQKLLTREPAALAAGGRAQAESSQRASAQCRQVRGCLCVDFEHAAGLLLLCFAAAGGVAELSAVGGWRPSAAFSLLLALLARLAAAGLPRRNRLAPRSFV